MHISKHYLNIPVARTSEMHVFQIQVDGVQKREFPVQLAENSPDYWIFIDVTEFQGQTITLSGPSSQAALNRIYQADKIECASSLYKVTSIAFILGVGPLYFATGAGAYGRHSVGTAIIGGMALSTFLNLFFIPVLYVILKTLLLKLSGGSKTSVVRDPKPSTH